jgi:hypothetical protein
MLHFTTVFPHAARARCGSHSAHGAISNRLAFPRPVLLCSIGEIVSVSRRPTHTDRARERRAPGFPAFVRRSSIEQDHMFLILGAGMNRPMDVDSVHIW